MFDYPNNLQKIFDKLDSNGIKPIIIGGYIRDKLMNIYSQQENHSEKCCFSKDIDIELYGVTSLKKLQKILEEFGDVNSVGKSFGVVKLSLDNLEIDFTLPRVDNKISSGHRGFNIEIQPDLDFKTATSRRDFTINAIGYDVVDKKILDPFEGQKDIKNKILKAVDIKTFAQDPLRVLRAAQFCSRFNLKMDNELFSLCKNMCDKNILNELAHERIFDEIKKILLKSPKPSIGFKLLKELNALKYLRPLDSLENDSFKDILLSLDNMAKLKTDSNKTNISLMLAVLCHKFDSKQMEDFISNLTNEKELLKNVTMLLKNKFKDKYSDSELFRLASEVNIEYFLILNRAVNSSVGCENFNIIESKAKKLNIFNKKAIPFLQGRDIKAFGLEPSKEYSKILKKAYEAQMDLKIKNREEAKVWLKNYLTL